ncbi:conjugal transfer protein TraF [Desulfurobacterium crinifex]
MGRGLLFLLFLIFPITSFAGGFFGSDKETGWFWKREGQETEKKVEEKKEVQKFMHAENRQPKELKNKDAELLASLPVRLTEKDLEKLTPAQIGELYSLYVERALYKPNIADYETILLIQNYAMRKSVAYTVALQKVLREHPEWNPAVSHPPSTFGRRVDFWAREEKISKMLRKWKDKAGLYFFFEENCAFCRAQAPILKRFQNFFGWKVLALSDSGGCLKEFPDCSLDYGHLAEKLGVSVFPAIFLGIPNFKDGKPLIQPVSYGLITLDSLKKTIYEILYTIENGHPPDVKSTDWKLEAKPELREVSIPKKLEKIASLLNKVREKRKEQEISRAIENQLWDK